MKLILRMYRTAFSFYFVLDWVAADWLIFFIARSSITYYIWKKKKKRGKEEHSGFQEYVEFQYVEIYLKLDIRRNTV